MRVRTVPLLNSALVSILGSSPWKSPEMPRAMKDALVVVTVEAVTGTPATATITPTFEAWHSTVGGNYYENFESTGSGASPVNTWYAITVANNPSLLPDGDWGSAIDVSSAVVGTPLGYFRRIDGGFPWRLSLAWALTGGTSPTMKVSAIAYIREGESLGHGDTSE